MKNVLGLGSGHDMGATLLQDGDLVAAANEERFNRVKHSSSLPFRSTEYCLKAGGITAEDVDAVAVASNRLTPATRQFLGVEVSPTDVSSISTDEGEGTLVSSGLSLGSRFFQKLTREPAELPRSVAGYVGSALVDDSGANDQQRVPDYARTVEFPPDVTVNLVHHHEAHAATAYYGCGHDDALVVTLDGFGDGLSGTVWRGADGELECLETWGADGSLGWFFGTVTQALGWWVGNGEGKTMGLAAFSEPDDEVAERLREILPKYEDGRLVRPHSKAGISHWSQNGTDHWLFEEAEYVAELIDQYGRERVAATAQSLLEEQVLNIVQPWLERTGATALATAGGLFLNVKVNRNVIRETDVEDYFIFPAAGDGGLSTGAALVAHDASAPEFRPFELTHPYYGPDITDGLPGLLDARHLTYERPDDIVEAAADLLAEGNIVAWCQGRMEYGPRALGNRSILIDPTLEDSKDRVNDRVKFRDSWRPFAPSILEDAVDEYLVDPVYDPFMITSFEVRAEKRDEIPAVTYVDGTSRPQVVRRSVNQRYYDLIDAFADRTGTPVVLNTSYNLSGEPIVCDARDAIKTFYDCGIDALALGDYLVQK
jgi:carbamoyltransferase